MRIPLLSVNALHISLNLREAFQYIDLQVKFVSYQVVRFGFGVVVSHIPVIYSDSPLLKTLLILR